MAQNDRNARVLPKVFEMVDNVDGKSQRITHKPYVPRDELTFHFNQNSYEYGAPMFYTVKEATSTITARRVIYQYSNEAAITKPVIYRPVDHIQNFGGARPTIAHADRFERPKERTITCDEALQRYGGVLIKEFRN